MSELIDPNTLGTAAMLAIVIGIIGRALKLIPAIPDWIIPWSALVMGGVGYPLLAKSWTAMSVVVGLITGATVVGLYQTGRQTMINRVEDAGKDVHPAVSAVFGTTPPKASDTPAEK
jgi:hypothetical protein